MAAVAAVARTRLLALPASGEAVAVAPAALVKAVSPVALTPVVVVVVQVQPEGLVLGVLAGRVLWSCPLRSPSC